MSIIILAVEALAVERSDSARNAARDVSDGGVSPVVEFDTLSVVECPDGHIYIYIYRYVYIYILFCRPQKRWVPLSAQNLKDLGRCGSVVAGSFPFWRLGRLGIRD